jgi:high-affinity Fe2+/Pb2+ permease
MTGQDRGELQFAAVIGAVLGGVIGYLLSYTVESGGWLKILVWAFIGAIVVAGMVFWPSGFSFMTAVDFPKFFDTARQRRPDVDPC